MAKGDQTRVYCPDECATFRSTKGKYGGLSNMAGGYPLRINGVLIPSAEALYQACRFPHKPDIQRHIIDQKSPMTAKMVSKPHRGDTRPDWMQIRVRVMRWVLRVKLAMHWPEFGGLLLATGDRPIVEDSRRDDFWGALRQENGTLVGMNVLGRLLMELREELKGSNKESLRVVAPPPIPDFLLLGQLIGQVGFGGKPAGVVADPDTMAKPGTLWASQIEGPEDDLGEEPAAAASSVASEEQLTRPKSTDRTMRYPKRLIEVDLPIKRISTHARKEKSFPVPRGHIATMHTWWARRPLAACRAVCCATLWPDPADPDCPQPFREAAATAMKEFAGLAVSSREIADLCDSESWSRYGELARSKKAMDLAALAPLDASGTRLPGLPTDLEKLRHLLLDFIADFAAWKASTHEAFLATARKLTAAAHQACGGTPGTRPLIVDPFAGGGAIPLEALRVGGDAFASDVNPVAVLLDQVALDDVPHAGAEVRAEFGRLAEWVADKTAAEIADLYPQTSQKWEPLAYFWARTVTCNGPGCGATVPMLRSLWLGTKRHPKYALVLETRGKRIRPKVIEVVPGIRVQDGTVKGASCTCPVCGHTMKTEPIREQLRHRRGGADDAMLLAVIEQRAETKERRFREPVDSDLRGPELARDRLREFPQERNKISVDIPTTEPRRLSVPLFGIHSFADIFNSRQLLSALVFAKHIKAAKLESRLAPAVRRVVSGLLAFALNKCVDFNCSLSQWRSSNEDIGHLFGRQAIGIVWDYAETNLSIDAYVSWRKCVSYIDRVLEHLVASKLNRGTIQLASALHSPLADDSCQLYFTDPPYYDSVPYSHLSDFFYVWLRAILSDDYKELFQTPVVPKESEIVVDRPHSLVRSPKTPKLYEERMQEALAEGRRITRPDGIGVVVFAHKSTSGWEALLSGLLEAGWVVTAAWPIDTESPTRTNAMGTASLASSVHLVCRPRENPDGTVRSSVGDWNDVLQALPVRIHQWMPRLSEEGIVGADAIFACLGPALEVFSRYSRVERASGEEVPLREYLEHVWAAVAQEALGMIFKGADATGFEEDARLTAMWLWTLSTGNGQGRASAGEDEEAEGESGTTRKKKANGRYVLEFDAARKIAQGLGAHLENLAGVVAVEGETARLLSVADRTAHLFGKDEAQAPAGRRKKDRQMKLGFQEEVERAEADGNWGTKGAPKVGETTLDRVHQAMILFAAGRSAALKRFLVEEGVGRDGRFWTLAQALSALYPSGSDERRWVDGVLARKKGLGF